MLSYVWLKPKIAEDLVKLAGCRIIRTAEDSFKKAECFVKKSVDFLKTTVSSSYFIA